MFSALKKLTKSNDERCPAPVPMSSSLQKKFSRGVHYNMKILIKGDRNVGKSCLLQRLQGGPFIEEYVPTEQIQVAPIHWTYKNSDHIVKVEVWEVVDKGRAKKKPPLGLKLENQDSTGAADDDDTPVLDATFLDVYKNANGVILMFDITKPWTFDYVVKELLKVPLDLPVVVLGNHCDMQHHRQVHSHHIDQALHDAKLDRTAPLRYAESSMRNGFGLRLLHKFLNVPFLRLQRTSFLEQLQRNQRDIDDVEQELNEFQCSEESQYDTFVDRLTNKRRASAGPTEPRPNERSPSIVLGAGKPIIPPNVNPLTSAQSLNPMGIKAMNSKPEFTPQPQQRQFVSSELLQPRHVAGTEMTPPKKYDQDSAYNTPSSTKNQSTSSAGGGGGDLDEFYAGALDTSFLEDVAPGVPSHEQAAADTDSEEDTINPMVNVDQDDLDLDSSSITSNKNVFSLVSDDDDVRARQIEERFGRSLSVREREENVHVGMLTQSRHVEDDLEFPMWAADSSARRSPEGGEDPDLPKDKDGDVKQTDKKHKKKKSKDKDSDKTEKKKHKSKKSKSDKKPNAQSGLLLPDDGIQTSNSFYDYDEDYDS